MTEDDFKKAGQVYGKIEKIRMAIKDLTHQNGPFFMSSFRIVDKESGGVLSAAVMRALEDGLALGLKEFEAIGPPACVTPTPEPAPRLAEWVGQEYGSREDFSAVGCVREEPGFGGRVRYRADILMSDGSGCSSSSCLDPVSACELVEMLADIVHGLKPAPNCRRGFKLVPVC